MMNFDIGKAIKNVSQIKLKGGIFQKASIVIIVISLCLFGVAALAGNFWISIIALVLIFTLAFVTLWRLLNFANKNPQAAILEGAEFLLHEQIKLAAKGVGQIPDNLSLLIEETSTNVNQQIANQPDTEK
jgi:membrane protein implicated in regulation of membrane protease activity